MECIDCNGGGKKCYRTNCRSKCCSMCESYQKEFQFCNKFKVSLDNKSGWTMTPNTCHGFRLNYKFREARRMVGELKK